jgi:opacity protein-like surface antigen
MLTDRVSIGAQVNYIQESIWHSDLSAFGLNFGVQYEVFKDGLAIGASVSNFGPRSGYSGRDLYLNYDFNTTKHGDNDEIPAELRTDSYSLPTIFRVGAFYPININESNRVLITVDATHPNDNFESLNLGAEWTILKSFSLRVGYRNLFLTDSEGGLTFGAGAQVELTPGYVAKFDYAYGDYGRLEQTHRFTVGIGF